MNDSRGESPPPELSDQKGSEEQTVVPEDEQHSAFGRGTCMNDSRGESPPPELSDQKGSEEQTVVPEDEQQGSLVALLTQRINELAALPEDEKQKEITAVISHTRTFSGPLPTPEAFAKYNKVLPGAADRILRMAEKEQDTRHEAQRGAIANDRRRIDATTIVALSIVGVAGVATWLGQELIAIPLGLAGVIGTMIRQIIVRRRRSE